jgi:hypothetical protein
MIWFSTVSAIFILMYMCVWVGGNISIIFQQSDILNLLYSYIDVMIK